MAEERPRAPRARKNMVEADGVAAEAASKPARAAATKPAAKKETTAMKQRKREPAVAALQPGDVAVRADLLWEQGALGDATDWLRAEQELAAA